MSTTRLVLLLAVGLAVGFLVLLLLTPGPSPEPAPPPPAAEPPKPPLQADAEGHYVPGYSFSVGRFRFTGFSLRPEAFVTFATSSATEQGVSCLEATITAASFHLRCEDRQVGSVTIDGKFLTRVATNRLDTPVVAAVVTIRSGSGDILYSARDSFAWDSAR